jgi:hypothetical protein
MNHLTRSLLEGLLEEDKKVVALYGGGFKPPIGGHFEVVDEALKQYPEIDELIILVGGGERNGISQAEAILIWEIYQDYLPPKVKIQPSKMPIGDIYSFAKNNPQDIIYWIIGRREGADDDNKDIIDRAKALKKNPEKYNNLDLKVITTQDESMRGRNSREAAKKGKLYFTPFLPKKLSKEDKSKVFDIVSPVLKENATYSQNIDYKQMIQDLTDYMIKKGRNIEPLPKVEFVDGDSENAKDFFGKTAYYDPNTQTIVLYTEGRHPKDIVRSFSHEMVHHTQFLEDRLGDVQTTNTTEDDNLDKIEQEANLVGTMTFRNWTDNIKEKKNKDPFGLNAYALELARGLEEGDTYEKMAAKGKKAGSLKQGTVRKRLGISKDKKIPLSLINKEIARLKKMDKDPDKKGAQLGDKNQKYYKALQLAKTLKTTTNINESDPKKGTGKKPKGSGRRLYTDEDPSDTVGIKFSTRQDIVDTLNKTSFKNKSHARQSQIINLIHQRVRAALGRTKDPKKKKKLQTAFSYIKKRKEASKEKTKRLQVQKKKIKENINGNYTIYSDMDGVLVDFDKRFKRFSDGIPPTEYEQKFGKDKFWELVDGVGVRFWVGMDWMSDGKQLWNYIKEYNPTLLSSPSRSNYSRMGKRIWRKRNLPSTKLILAQAANKQNYADPDSILIDDRESNVDQWIKAGGIGILHTDTVSTINKLKELGL